VDEQRKMGAQGLQRLSGPWGDGRCAMYETQRRPGQFGRPGIFILIVRYIRQTKRFSDVPSNPPRTHNAIEYLGMVTGPHSWDGEGEQSDGVNGDQTHINVGILSVIAWHAFQLWHPREPRGPERLCDLY
jgi:hypothetical protein